MKKINNELKTINVKGKILMIGEYEPKYYEMLLKNDEVTFLEQLSHENISHFKKLTNEKNKKINIKKIKARYKKKGIDNLLVREEQIKSFKNTFVSDSIYITKNKIYLIKTKESTQIEKMYRRYTNNIEKINCLDGDIIVIDTSKIKINKLKNKIYYLIDNIKDFLNVIGDFLAN